MADDRLYDLVIEWDRRRRLGEDVSPEELCQSEPGLLESLKDRIESVKLTDWMFEPDETVEDNSFLTLPDLSTISFDAEKESLPATTLTVEGFCRAIAESGLLPLQETQNLQTESGAMDARGIAAWLVSKGKLTHYQAAVLLEQGKEPLVLDRYVILDRLGAGGMGQVFKAVHRTMERLVALKILPPGSLDSVEKAKRFQREVKAASKLCHPNIVMAHDAYESGGIHFLVMELVEGKDLHKLVRQVGPLALQDAIDCVLQAAKGLEHAHANGIIHRDIKPSNLLLDKSGTVKVLDMGLARTKQGGDTDAASQELTHSGSAMGTVAFMSPEQALDAKHADHRSDIYSLGCTLYFLLTGHPPYQGDQPMKTLVAHREEPVPSLKAVRREVPESFDAVFQTMMAKRPEDRYHSMTAVLQALEACKSRIGLPGGLAAAEGNSLPATQTYVAERDQLGSPKPRRPRWRVGVVALALLLVGGLSLAGILVKIKTPHGTVVIECDSSEVEGAVVSVDGQQKITLKATNDAEPIAIQVDKGRRLLEVAKGGFKTFTEEFAIGGGERKPIRLHLERTAEQPERVGVTGAEILDPSSKKGIGPRSGGSAEHRWFGSDLGWEPKRHINDLLPYCNFIIDTIWISERNKCSYVKAARPHGIKVVMCVFGKGQFDAFRKWGVFLAKANSDVVMGVVLQHPYSWVISPSDVRDFIRETKQAIPGFQVWIIMDDDPTREIPDELDVIVLSCSMCRTIAEFKDAYIANPLKRRWELPAKGRPLGLAWSHVVGWKNEEWEPGVCQTIGKVAKDSGATVLILHAYESVDTKVIGIAGLPKLLSEFRAVGQAWGAVDRK